MFDVETWNVDVGTPATGWCHCEAIVQAEAISVSFKSGKSYLNAEVAKDAEENLRILGKAPIIPYEDPKSTMLGENQ